MSGKKQRETAEGEAVQERGSETEEGRPTSMEPEDVPSLREALAQEREKAEQYMARWQRSQADFANFKKRTEQERSDHARFANSVLMESLLPVLDDLERALDSVDRGGSDATWIEGIDLIYRKLLSTLESQGLTRIEAEGREFDPNCHQAVTHEEGEEGKVLEELQKGYTLGDRLLRPAMVKVGKGKA